MAKTILLADDSITIQKIVNLTFSGEGIEVVTVGNGDAAIKKVYDIHPDLVLADIFMPGKNGYEVCEYIKGERDLQRTPVILLVGAFEPFDTNEAARVQADGHLTKPFEIKVLLSAVNSLISATGGDKAEPGDQAPERPEAASITVGSPAQTDGEPSVQEIPEQIDGELGLRLEEESSSSDTTVAVTEESLAYENPIVSPSLKLDQDIAPEFLVTEAAEKPISLTPSTSGSVDDSDPLGLYSSESAGARLRQTEAPVDAKGLVVDIWEPRATSVNEGDLLSELVEDRRDANVNTTTLSAEQPVPSIETHSSEPVEQTEHKPPVQNAFEAAPSMLAAEAPGPILYDALSAFRQDDGVKTKVSSPSIQVLDQPELVDSIVQRVIEKLSKEVIEKIAWEVVPDLAEIIIKEQLESHLKSSGKM